MGKTKKNLCAKCKGMKHIEERELGIGLIFLVLANIIVFSLCTVTGVWLSDGTRSRDETLFSAAIKLGQVTVVLFDGGVLFIELCMVLVWISTNIYTLLEYLYKEWRETYTFGSIIQRRDRTLSKSSGDGRDSEFRPSGEKDE